MGHMVCSVFQVAAIHQRTVHQEAGGGDGKLPSALVHAPNVRSNGSQRQVGNFADRLLADWFTSVGGTSRRVFPHLISASRPSPR